MSNEARNWRSDRRHGSEVFDVEVFLEARGIDEYLDRVTALLDHMEAGGDPEVIEREKRLLLSEARFLDKTLKKCAGRVPVYEQALLTDLARGRNFTDAEMVADGKPVVAYGTAATGHGNGTTYQHTGDVRDLSDVTDEERALIRQRLGGKS